MFRKLRKVAVIFSAVLPLAAGVAARADRYDLTSYIAPSAAQTAPAFAPAGGLTPQSLETLVASMGFDYTTNDNTLNEHDYTLNISRAGWDFHIRVAISKDRKNLWFSTSLGKIGDGCAPALLKLLEKNSAITPAYFTYHADNQKLYLDMPIRNEFMTAKVLNQRLEDFVTIVTETSSLWDRPELKAQTASAFGK